MIKGSNIRGEPGRARRTGFHICERRSGNGERDVEVFQAKSKQAMKQVLGIRDEAARMKVTPPLAVEDMRWNPNDDGVNFNP